MRNGIVVTLLIASWAGLAGCNARPAAEGGGGIAPTTGAHTVHLTGTLSEALTCNECHNPAFEVTLQGPLATANGAQGSFNSSTLTCSNVYCHAGGPQLQIGGGTVPLPVWDPPSAVACGGCHAAPGGELATPWHPAVAAGVQCVLCHPGYTNTTVDRVVHVNGVVNLKTPDLATNCAACHGDATRVLPEGAPAVLVAAPPVDRSGSSDTTRIGVGAHQSHLMPGANAITSPIACSECHVVPEDLSHVGPLADTPATLEWGPVARANGATPAFDASTATCANYCHGQTLNAGGANVTPIWTKVDGTQAACGACHASPPPDLPHVVHVSTVAPDFPCSTCHPAGYSRDAIDAAALPYHVNGQRDVNATNLPGWNPSAPGPNGWSGTSVGCHGGTRYWNPGVPNSTCQ